MVKVGYIRDIGTVTNEGSKYVLDLEVEGLNMLRDAVAMRYDKYLLQMIKRNAWNINTSITQDDVIEFGDIVTIRSLAQAYILTHGYRSGHKLKGYKFSGVSSYIHYILGMLREYTAAYEADDDRFELEQFIIKFSEYVVKQEVM